MLSNASANPNTTETETAALHSQCVRRTDVTLRSRYPQLQTRIFQLSGFVYRIVFESNLIKAEEIEGEFATEICPATIQISLSNEIPNDYLKELPIIPDHELSKGFAGLPMNRDDIRNILSGKFPDLPELVETGSLELSIMRLAFSHPLTEEQASIVTEFFRQWEPGWQLRFEVAQKPVEENKKKWAARIKETLGFQPNRTRPTLPKFAQEDDAFWFDNIDQIYAGGLSPGRIIDPDTIGTACYIDSSVDEQIDIRQLLLCYDTIFLTPPLMDERIQFWKTQHVSRSHLISLAGLNRLKFILRQPEERTDIDLLNQAYMANPTSIIGRRKAAAIFASDLVQTTNEFIFNQADVLPNVPKLALALSKENRVPQREVMQLLTWPVAARRACLHPLLSTGVMSVSSFGQGRLLGDELKRITGQDVELEALIFSEGVHIAHALNATLIPPTNDIPGWIEPRRIIGDRLNFYRSFNTRVVAAWAVSERLRETRTRVLPPIPLFKFSRFMKLEHLLNLTKYRSDRRKGRALISRLSELPLEERQAETDRLAQELYERGAKNTGKFLTFDTFKDAKEVATYAFGSSTLPIPSMWRLFGKLITDPRGNPTFDSFLDILERDLNFWGSNEDIDFLAKIERVAELG